MVDRFLLRDVQGRWLDKSELGADDKTVIENIVGSAPLNTQTMDPSLRRGPV